MEMKSNKNKAESKKRKSSSKGSKQHSHVVKKKERGVIPYIVNPIIYILVSLVVVIPVFMAFLNYSVNAVHNAQEVFTYDYNDVEVNSVRSDNKTLPYENDLLGVCEKVGVLSCEDIGLKTDVYYGVNRVSLRNGAGLSTKSSFGGYDAMFNIAGYSTRAFKSLNNASSGDKIVFETTDKIYEYTVVNNSVGANPEPSVSSGMILSCDENSKAFSVFNSEKRYVVAQFLSIKDKKGE